MADGDDYREVDERVAATKLARRAPAAPSTQGGRNRAPVRPSYPPLEPRGYEPQVREGERPAVDRHREEWTHRSEIGAELWRRRMEREAARARQEGRAA